MKGDVLTLSLPAASEYLLPLRLFASGVATRMNFSIDQVEDIRRAVSEAGILLLDGVCRGELHIRMEITEDLVCDLTLENCPACGGCREIDEDGQEMAKLILEAMVDHADFAYRDEKCVGVYLRFDGPQKEV